MRKLPLTKPPLNEVDLSEIADKLLKTSFAKHLVREEADRQIKAWIKRYLAPAIMAFVFASAVLGWGADVLSNKMEALQKKYEDLGKGVNDEDTKIVALDTRIGSTDTKVNETTAHVSIAQDLVKDAQNAADQGNKAAIEGSRTVQASLGLVKDTDKDVLDAIKASDTLRRQIEDADKSILDLRTEKAKLANEIDGLRKESDAVTAQQKDLEAKYKVLSNGIDAIHLDYKRFRVFRIQVLSTGRDINNDVVFGDPEGNGSYTMTVANLNQSSGSSNYFNAYLTIKGPGSKTCAIDDNAKLQFGIPYDLEKENHDREKIQDCLPKGVKLFIDATPYVQPLGRVKNPEKYIEPPAQFVILRVDTMS